LQVTPFQPFYLHLVSELAKCMGDPDWRVITEGRWSYAKGVPVGVGIRMPRAPAVFERKQAWRNLDETAYEPDSQNYKSAEAALPDLIRQMEEEAPLGMCYECTEGQARKDYPGDALRIAAIGAIEKGDSTFRIIHDGTHGVHVNPQTQPRDRLRMPGPAEQRAIQERAARTKMFHFVLKADVGKAHRRFLNRREDWGLQACRLRPGHLWINRVGTFGVGTACYWWGRLAAALDRITWLCCPMEEIWQLIYADDLFWAAAGPTRYTDILAFLLLWVVMGTPIKWKKCQGGIEVEWLGYWVDYGRFQLGISEARAAWLVQWLRRALEQGTVLVSTLVAVLGRLGFAAGVLEWDRPFLGPLYAWTSAVPASAFVRLPVLVRLILEYLAQRLAEGLRVIDSALSSRQLGQLFMTDAKAEDNLVVLGGWETTPGHGTTHARWFSVRVAPGDLPGLYGRAKPQHEIATWELLASLVAVMVFLPDRFEGRGLTLATGATDNQGNAYAVSKLLTSKYPLCVVLMKRQLWLDLEWTPRERNVEADALTNEDFAGFDPERRIVVDLAALPYAVMTTFLDRCAELYATLESVKRKRLMSAAAGPAEHARGRKSGRRGGLKESDPWA